VLYANFRFELLLAARHHCPHWIWSNWNCTKLLPAGVCVPASRWLDSAPVPHFYLLRQTRKKNDKNHFKTVAALRVTWFLHGLFDPFIFLVVFLRSVRPQTMTDSVRHVELTTDGYVTVLLLFFLREKFCLMRKLQRRRRATNIFFS